MKETIKDYWENFKGLFSTGDGQPAPINGMDEPTSLILILMKMARADGEVNHFEQMNTFLLTNTLKADANLIREYSDNLDNVPLIAPRERNEREDYFWRILTMMKMDLHAHPEELKMCEELGKVLKFSSKEVKKAIDYMTENMNKTVGFEEFQQALK
jgi:uncharacterized tellurite resistance protein B-like protein